MFGGIDGLGVCVNGLCDDDKRLSNTLNIGIKGLFVSIMFMEFSELFVVSVGVVCYILDVVMLGGVMVLSVLEVMNVFMEYVVGTLRLSVGRYIVERDVERGAVLLIDVVKR